jgi:hypothetical protein
MTLPLELVLKGFPRQMRVKKECQEETGTHLSLLTMSNSHTLVYQYVYTQSIDMLVSKSGAISTWYP